MISISAAMIGRFRGFLDFDFSACSRIILVLKSISDSPGFYLPLPQPALYKKATKFRTSVAGIVADSDTNFARARNAFSTSSP